jgi:hypothetical protein
MSHITQPISDEMLGAHQPPEDADESFQESWGFLWHDPVRHAGGIQHVSYQRVRGITDAKTWIAYDGRVIGHRRNFSAPPLDVDFPNWSGSGITVRAENARSFQMHTTPSSSTGADLRFAAFTDPILYSLDAEGATWGSDHYELIGRVNGTVALDGHQHQVSGFGWQDHSWGPRNMGHLLSHRWLLAMFGPDLFCSVMAILTATGPEPLVLGFIYDNGELHSPTAVHFGARMEDDGYTPRGCDAQIWTESGVGYQISGTVKGAQAQAQRGGMWCVDGLSTFTAGHRLGAGIFETQEMRGPAPWLYEELGLNDSGAVPAPPDRSATIGHI